MPNEKPILHNSHFSMLLRCGEQYRRRYIENEKKQPNSALIIGVATHETNHVSLQHKIDNQGEIKTLPEVQDIARDAVVKEYNDNGLRLINDEQKEQGSKRVIGECIDTTVNLASVYHQHFTPTLNPTEVEWPFVVECNGYPYDLAGQIDVNESSSFRDTKTSKSRKNQKEADSSQQFTLYSLAWKTIKKKYPDAIYMDTLVNNKNPYGQIVETKRNDEDVAIFLRRFETVCKCLEKGIFLPANPHDWWCSREWCGYAETCPYFFGRKTIGVIKDLGKPEPKIKESSNERKRTKKRIIKPGSAEYCAESIL